MRLVYAISAVAIPLLVFSCGETVSVDGQPTSLDGLGGEDITNDGGPSGSAIDGAATVPPESDGADDEAACGSRPDELDGAFVTVTGTDDDRCGPRARPCKTISRAIERAFADGHAHVYVGPGLYVEQLKVRANVSVVGGWATTDAGWSRLCADAADAVTVRAPTTANTTVEASALKGEARLSFLHIESKAHEDAKPGESLYGVFATGQDTVVRLDHVTIAVDDAGKGQDGQAGKDGAPAPATCTVGAGKDGTPGTSGKAATASFGVGGFVTTVATSGTDGTPGDNSVAGAAGACSRCGACNGVCIFNAGDAGDETCGSPGGSGCGGGAGTAGTAATSGGSSVGVFAWDAQVTIAASHIAAGNGGSGGNGGAGGAGQSGTVGAQGAASTKVCLTSCTGLIVKCQENKTAGKGGAGSAGGKGGSGGDGGSGVGGASYAIYQGGLGLVSTTDTVLSHGSAGAGGVGKLPAAGGTAGDRFP